MRFEQLAFVKQAAKNGYYKVMPVLLVIIVKIRWLLRTQERPHCLDHDLIISLTSYPPRFPTLIFTIKCLLTQSIRPNRVLLWIARNDEKLLPDSILILKDKGILDVRICENIRSYKKIIPTLTNYDNSFVVTADDDLYFGRHWLKKLVDEFHKNPDAIPCHRAHCVELSNTGVPMPYNKWRYNITGKENCTIVFPTSGAGVLWPPGIFHCDICNTQLFMTLCPTADDVWLFWMLKLNGAIARKVGGSHYLIQWNGSQTVSLSKENVDMEENDIQINNMVMYYGFPE